MAKDAKKNTVPLKKVVLYKHGMGYFERRGEVDGAASVEILCGATDIDDMLKSLMVLTADGAPLEAITYDSAKTLEQRMTEFGFDVRQTEGLIDIIVQVKGLPVKVTASSTTYSGKVIGIDTLEHISSDNKIAKELFLVILADATFKRVAMNKISSIEVDDESFSKELNQQLELLFSNAKKKDKKALTVKLPKTSGEVVVAYSIPSPIWKTSYRLVVQDEALLLQGMAIVDNVQDEDWENVQMVLVSAAPISFIQPLYDPIQPFRRTVRAQGFQSGGPVKAERAQVFQEQVETGSWGAPAPAAAPMPGSVQMKSVGALFKRAVTDEDLKNLPVEAGSSGELFEYKIATAVTVPRNTSALIPIVQEKIDGERISLYNMESNKQHPYHALRLRNTSGLTLEAGPVTVVDQDSYAGEALLDVLKPDDTRLLQYALDQDCHVIVREDHSAMPVFRVRSVGGALYMDYRIRHSKFYRIENLAKKDKTVYVEHRVDESMKLISKDEPLETTQNFYRFEVKLKAEEKRELAVTQEQEFANTIWLTDPEQVNWSSVQYWIDSGELNRDMVAFLQAVMAKQQQVIYSVQKLQEIARAIERYSKDQERARENLKALGAHGTNSERFEKAIEEAEDRIAKASEEMAELQREVAAKRNEFAELIQAQVESDIKSAAGRSVKA